MTKTLVAVISGFQEPNYGFESWGIPEDQQIRFSEWMIKESPWAHCFLNPNGKDVVENNWLLSADTPSNMLASACMGTRLISEFPARFKVWNRLVELGLDGTRAYVASQNSMATGDKKDTFPVQVNVLSGHNPFHGYWYRSYYESFLYGKPQGDQGKPYKECLKYSGTSNLWGGDKGYGIRDALHGIVPRKERKAEDTKDIWYNPYKMETRKDHKFRNDQELLDMWEDMERIILSR